MGRDLSSVFKRLNTQARVRSMKRGRARIVTCAVWGLLALFAPAGAECVAAAAQVAWVKTYDAARARAASEKKPVVIDFAASWCGYCRRMAQEVYPDPEFVAFSRAAVFIRYFADRDPEGGRLARKFGVRGFPTLIILDSKGEEVDRLVGARSKPQLISELEQLFAEAGEEGDALTELPEPARPGNARDKPAVTPSETVAPPPEAPRPPAPATVSPDALPPGTAEPVWNTTTHRDEKDPIVRLEKRLAAANDDSERNWLNLMLGIAHLQAQHFKEARDCLGRVLEKDPQNAAALEAMTTLKKFSIP